MITVLTTFLGNPLNILKVLIWTVVVVAIGFVEYKVYDAGYNASTIKYEATLAAIKQASATEVAKEVAANSAALSEANKATAALQAQIDKYNKELSDSNAEALKDPDANKPAIGLSSVQRLNAVAHRASAHSSKRTNGAKVQAPSKAAD